MTKEVQLLVWMLTQAGIKPLDIHRVVGESCFYVTLSKHIFIQVFDFKQYPKPYMLNHYEFELNGDVKNIWTVNCYVAPQALIKGLRTVFPEFRN